MKKRSSLQIILYLSVVLFCSAFAALFLSKAYSNAKEHYEQSFAPKAPVIFTLSHKNISAKYLFEFIDEDFYVGYEYMYKRDDVLFFSVTDAWDESMLTKLADELYANIHGEEINYVDKVVVLGSSDDAAGSHSTSMYTYPVPISCYGFFPEYSSFQSSYEKSTIFLYGVDDETTIEDVAPVLSHEYGHHYTIYYFGLTGDNEDKESRYYELRSVDNKKISTNRETYTDYYDHHKWYLLEIAAEDYVYLMGSPSTQRILEFYDNYDKYNLLKDRQYDVLDENDYDYTWCKNGAPHENVELPMPVQVEGLGEYFYSFVDEEYTFDYDLMNIGDLNLSMTYVPAIQSQHKFTWRQPYADSEILYTLIVYDMDDNILAMVKTTHGDQKALAHLGLFYWGEIANPYYDSVIFTYETGKEMKARVSITFPDGSVIISDPYVFIY